MHQKIKIIPMKIHKTVATTAAPFGSDMHQIVCRLGLRPDPTGGAYSAPPDPLAGLRGPRGPTSKGRRGEGRGRGRRGGEWRGREGGERDPQRKFNKSSTGREERGREGKKGKGSVLPQCSSVPL